MSRLNVYFSPPKNREFCSVSREGAQNEPCVDLRSGKYLRYLFKKLSRFVGSKGVHDVRNFTIPNSAHSEVAHYYSSGSLTCRIAFVIFVNRKLLLIEKAAVAVVDSRKGRIGSGSPSAFKNQKL